MRLMDISKGVFNMLDAAIITLNAVCFSLALDDRRYVWATMLGICGIINVSAILIK